MNVRANVITGTKILTRTIKALPVVCLSALLYAQAPAITGVGSYAPTTTSFAAYWTSGFAHDATTDTTLTDGFTTAAMGTSFQIHVGSTANHHGNDHYPPTRYVMGGKETFWVVSVDDATHEHVTASADPNGGIGGSDWSDYWYLTQAGLSVTISANVATATGYFDFPDWWTTNHRIWVAGSLAPSLSNYNGGSSYAITNRVDSTHIQFSVSCSPGCNGTWNSATDPDMFIRSAPFTVHAGGETISLLESDAAVCYGNPGGPAGTYLNQATWYTASNIRTDMTKHVVHVRGLQNAAGSTIHWIAASTPTQYGATDCASLGAHTGVSADQTITLPSSDATTPAAPVGVSFSVAPPTCAHTVVSSGATLQADIDTARSTAGCTILTLPANATGTAPSGGYILKPQTNGATTLQIRTSASDSNLPAQGACKPPLYPSEPNGCIDNASYSTYLATLQTHGAGEFLFSVPDNTKVADVHLGPGLKLQANPASTGSTYLSLISLGHFVLGTGVYDHSTHVQNIVLDRIYCYEKNVTNMAGGCMSAFGGSQIAVVDSVTEGLGRRDNDEGGLEFTGDDPNDCCILIQNSKLQAGSMPVYLNTERWPNRDVLIQRNLLTLNQKFNATSRDYFTQVQLPVASISTANPAVITLSEPHDIDVWHSLRATRPLSLVGMTGSDWTPYNAVELRSLNGDLTSISVSSNVGSVTTANPHGWVTGQSIWISGLSGDWHTGSCLFLNGFYTITRDSATAFHFTTENVSDQTCSWPEISILGPVFDPSPTGNPLTLTIPLDTSAFGALGGTITARYGDFVDVKNTSESKACSRCEWNGNIIEKSIAFQQYAAGLALTNRSQYGWQDHANPYVNITVSDVNVHNNWFRTFGTGITSLGIQDSGQSVPSARIRTANNLLTDSWLGQCQAGDTCLRYSTFVSHGNEISYEHNTAMGADGVSFTASLSPPAFGDWTLKGNILSFGLSGIVGPSGQAGGQLYMTSGSCPGGSGGHCYVSNAAFPNALTWSRNAFMGTAADSGSEPFSSNRSYYDANVSGVNADYKAQYWPYGLAGVAFAGANTITGATNATPIVLTLSAMSCTPDAGDRYWVTGVGGNLGANNTWLVTSPSSTSLTLLGSVGSGSYTSGGVAIPVTGKCNLAENWALSGASTFKAGVSHVSPENPFLDSPTCSGQACPGSGPALDNKDVGVSIPDLITAISAVLESDSVMTGAATMTGGAKIQ